MLKALLEIMENNFDTYMPGFTHLQKAQPVTLANMLALILKYSRETFSGQKIYMRE